MANSILLTYKYQYSNDQLSIVETISDNNLLVIDESVAASATVIIPCVFNHSNLSAVYLTVSTACTATWDGSSNPALTLVAGDVYVWSNKSHLTSPFPASATTLTIVNADSVNPCIVDCRVLYH